MRLDHTRKHGLFMQKVAATNDNVEKLKLLDEYMNHDADDVQSFLHHIEQGSVYCGKASAGIAEITDPLHLPGHKSLSMRLIPD